MTPEPAPSLAASLVALVLALMVAALVPGLDWTPWEAVAVVGAGALFLVLAAIFILLAMIRNPRDRAEAWKVIMDTAKADLQPFVALWRLIRGRRR